MTREHKLALVVGFGLVLFVGILIADHVAAERRVLDQVAAVTRIPMPEGIFQGSSRLAELPQERSTASARETGRNTSPVDEGPVIEHAPRQQRSHLGRHAAPAPTPAGADATPALETYIVRKGDSLSRIAKRELGDQNRWRDIQTLNGIKGSNIVEGQKLRIPSTTSNDRAAASRLREVETRSREYSVRPGDSLGLIAQRELGSESRWQEIQSLNRIGGTTIRPGQTLLLPSR
ncbi:MAG: hypothetical protein CMJ34_01820 [Phycisphaerae bacterium]|nr:hypothetical protein [Phycisphaerae bacterium]